MVMYVKGDLRLAPALIAMEREANTIAPARSKASDGSFPSAAHSATNPTSDHETGNALDLTHDPGDFDIAERFRLIVARRDPRVKYLIHNGTIWKSYANRGLAPWTPQVYTGTNAHKSHGHTSVYDDARRNDTSPWWPEEDSDMPLNQQDLNVIRLIIAEELAKNNDTLYERLRVKMTSLRDSLATLIKAD